MASVTEIGRQARAASRAAQVLSAGERDAALRSVYAALESSRAEIEAANATDRANASARGVKATLSKRLDLSGRKFDAMLANVASVRQLGDPVGAITLARALDEGLNLYRVSAPIGVLAIVYEARPEAGVQIASLALKSANAVILKGGSEAEATNIAVVDAIRRGLKSAGYPVDAVQLLTTRAEVKQLLACDEHVDLVIPRGSNDLVRYVQSNTTIPVMGHADGLCAVYVDDAADEAKAVRIALDAKTQYPAVCNAAETLLCAPRHLAAVGRALASAGVELRAEPGALDVLKAADVKCVPAAPGDFDEEFLCLQIAVKLVNNVDEAIAHINEHGSGHTDVIVTEDKTVARRFLDGVDSAGVFHNASSRFADGYRYGFGAEVGISTHRTHARGPVGVEGLMIYKYKLLGDGHVVAPYADGEKEFTHTEIEKEVAAQNELV